MKKLLCVLAVAMLVSCGEKADINPLGSREKEIVVTDTQTITTEKVNIVEDVFTTTSPKAVRMEERKVEEPVIVDVPYYSQAKYPTGCEPVSTTMVLAFYGFEIKADELLKKGYLKSAEPKKEDNILYGADPDKVFIGSPDSSHGYGCMSGAVILALHRFLSSQEHILDKKYEITDLSGKWLDELCMEYIDRGIPVIVWCSINMKPTFINLRNSWIVMNTGERYIWKSNEHCLVLVGYDSENYYFNDPLVSKNVPYAKSIAERRYIEMGMQAVAVEEID